MRICLPFLSALALQASLGVSQASIEALRAREAKVKQVVTKVMPSVVAVVGTGTNATGSGVVVSKGGLVMTAGHVTEAAGEELLIIFPDGRSVKGESLGANLSRDAGLAKITDEGEWPSVEIGDSEMAELGDWVVALGHPGGFDLTRSPPVRLGRIVNKGQMGMLCSDCTLVGGDSGGALFDLEGKVIGIHSSIGGSLAENRHVPSSVFRNDWDRMLAGDVWGSLGMMAAGVDPDRPMLGVQMTESGSKVVVQSVLPGSPALKAGVRKGDVILEVDGIKPEQISDVIDQVSSHRAGDEIEMRLGRGGAEKEVSMKLVRWEDLAGGMRRGDRPPDESLEPASGKPHLGVILDVEAGAGGATVHEVMRDSPAERGGFRNGDVVVGINGQGIDSVAAMAEQLGTMSPGDSVEFLVRRDGEDRTLEVELGEQ